MRNIELNPKQYELMQAIYNNSADYIKPDGRTYNTGFKATGNWGRGTGKTKFMLYLIAVSVRLLPRAVGGVWSSTFKAVLNIVLAQSDATWKVMGLTEFDEKINPLGNYVVNRKPPNFWHRAYNSPKSYENTIAFANGYLLQLLSADRPDTQRGLNFDQLFGDEVGFTKKEFYTKVLLPALRANPRIYHDSRPKRERFNHPLHWLSVMFSSLPYSISGRWFLEMEELMAKDPSKYFFSRANAYDNLRNLPGDYIDDQRAELSTLEFDVEVLNKITDRLPNGFYSSFEWDRNVSTKYVYRFDEATSKHITIDKYYDPLKTIDMSWDFNAYFTCMITAQDFIPEYKEYVFNDCFFAKESKTTLVEAVCDDFINEYKDHINKVIYLHGDNSGKNKSADRNISIIDKIKTKLRAAQWSIIDKVQTTYPSYKSRYILINDLLAENKPRYPKLRYHQEKCSSLIRATQNTRVEKDTFQKYKGEEGREDIPQELAPHLTDAMDYLLMIKFSNLSTTENRTSSPIRFLQS